MMGFLRGSRGATAIEYALIAGLISIVILGALTQISPQVQALFQAVADGLSGR